MYVENEEMTILTMQKRLFCSEVQALYESFHLEHSHHSFRDSAVLVHYRKNLGRKDYLSLETSILKHNYSYNKTNEMH